MRNERSADDGAVPPEWQLAECRVCALCYMQLPLASCHMPRAATCHVTVLPQVKKSCKFRSPKTNDATGSFLGRGRGRPCHPVVRMVTMHLRCCNVARCTLHVARCTRSTHIKGVTCARRRLQATNNKKWEKMRRSGEDLKKRFRAITRVPQFACFPLLFGWKFTFFPAAVAYEKQICRVRSSEWRESPGKCYSVAVPAARSRICCCCAVKWTSGVPSLNVL